MISFYNSVCVCVCVHIYVYIYIYIYIYIHKICEDSLAAVSCRFHSSVRKYKIAKINGRHHAIYCFYGIMRVCAPLVMRLMRVRCDI